jgi:hypothetical protein
MRVILLLVAACGSLAAQATLSAKTAVISFVEGRVSAGGEPIAPTGRDWPQVPEGVSLQTWGRGRAELLLNSCVVLHLDVESAVRVVSNRAEDTRVELTTGAAMVEADAVLRGTRVTVVVGGASVPVTRPGLFRFDADPARLRVFGGSATVQRKDGARVTVRKGRNVLLDGSDEGSKFDPDRRSDALGRWSETRIGTLATLSGQRVADAREEERRQAALTSSANVGSSKGPLPRAMAEDYPIQPLPTTTDAVLAHPSEAVRICAGPRW